ncbi:MAG TPA: cell division protein ZapA [Bryobacteraceae bacterium]|nr:cell division protein ZapA [Bryobacteraceae bacterium]
MAKQPVRVHIFHQSYTMLAEGDPREVEDLAHRVDELMASIAAATNSADSTRVAVLACFHLADKLRSAEQRLQAMEKQYARLDALLTEAIDKT